MSFAASDALLLSGLRRAASLAGMQEVDDGASASLTMRSVGAGEPHRSLDLEVGLDTMVLRLGRLPSREEWWRLLMVLELLWDGQGGADTSRQ